MIKVNHLKLNALIEQRVAKLLSVPLELLNEDQHEENEEKTDSEKIAHLEIVISKLISSLEKKGIIDSEAEGLRNNFEGAGSFITKDSEGGFKNASI